MASLHRPSKEPGLKAVRALQSLHERGHPAGWLAGDRAYTDAKPENFALPARALGHRVILDYAEDHRGIQGESNGFVFIEGTWYCPAIPAVLVNATIDLANHAIDEATYRARLAERRRYAALFRRRRTPKGTVGGDTRQPIAIRVGTASAPPAPEQARQRLVSGADQDLLWTRATRVRP